MRTDQLSFEGRPAFERGCLGLLGIGAATGTLSLVLDLSVLHAPWPAAPAMLLAVALLAASNLRGSDDTLPFFSRVLLAVLAAAIGASFGSGTVLAVALGGFTGLAMAGNNVSGERRMLGLLAGMVAAGWVLWTVPALQWLLPPSWPVTARAIATGAVSGLLFGAGLAVLHVRVHADALAARLQRLSGETGARLQRVWERCHASLRTAPSGSRREVLRLLEENARGAERLAGALASIDARLKAADRKDAQAQVEQLRTDVATTTDARARARLSSAAASLSDSLEALDAMERQRERLDAELRLKLATLERAALSLETAQGEPAELSSLVLRLSQQPAEA